jgi:hypothetical protein
MYDESLLKRAIDFFKRNDILRIRKAPIPKWMPLKIG